MRKGEVCGACSGALMVLGSLYGQYDLSDTASRQTANEVNDVMMKGYARENNLFKERCPQFVENAMDVLAEIIRGRQ